MSDKKDFFKLKKITTYADILSGKETELPTSDLSIKADTFIAQFELVEQEEIVRKKDKIKPGSFSFVYGNSGLELADFTLRDKNLLQSVGNTKKIKDKTLPFFQKLHVYEKYNQPKKRGFLMYSKPGMGKTATISRICLDLIQEDVGTVVIFWDTSAVRASDVFNYFSAFSEFTDKCTRFVLIMEDIGGKNEEGESSYRHASADAGILNLLDGPSLNFSIPTIIFATTNTPQGLLQSLADRPQRFDEVFELEPPSAEERVELASFTMKRDLSEEESNALLSKKADGLSIAHVIEIVMRSEIYDKTFEEVVSEIKKHKDTVNNNFTQALNKMGLANG